MAPPPLPDRAMSMTSSSPPPIPSRASTPSVISQTSSYCPTKPRSPPTSLSKGLPPLRESTRSPYDDVTSYDDVGSDVTPYDDVPVTDESQVTVIGTGIDDLSNLDDHEFDDILSDMGTLQRGLVFANPAIQTDI